MLYGIEVYNETGSVQFNSMAKNASLFGSGVHNVTTGSSSSPVGTRSILTVTSNTFPMIAFRPQGSVSMCVYQIQVTGTTYNYYIMCSGDSTSQINWWGFNYSPPIASGYGIEVYDATSALTYSSSTKTLKIIPVGSQVSARSYAMILGGISGTTRWTPFGTIGHYVQNSYFDGVQSTSTQVHVNNFLADRATGNIQTFIGPTVTYGPQNIIVTDVTGY